MTKDDPEYKRIKAEHDAEAQYREEHPELFPWFAYFQYSWHFMRFMNEEECAEAVRFYHLHEDGRGGFCRYGRQPINIMRRKEKNGK